MDHLADNLDNAVDTLTTMERRLPGLTVPAAAFGADDAGLPGRLGRDLFAHWSAVIDARAREAASAATRIAGMAGSVRATKEHYTTTDEAAARLIRREN